LIKFNVLQVDYFKILKKDINKEHDSTSLGELIRNKLQLFHDLSSEFMELFLVIMEDWIRSFGALNDMEDINLK